MIDHLILICHPVGCFLHWADYAATSIFSSLPFFFVLFWILLIVNFQFQMHLVYTLSSRGMPDLAGAENAI